MKKDHLTGIPDISSFKEAGNKVLSKAASEDRYAVIFFNIDNFKLYNSDYGREAGDELLKFVAGVLAKEFKDEVYARIADDHFAVLTKTDDIQRRVRDVYDTVQKYHKDTAVELKAGIYVLCKGDDVLYGCDCAKIACDSIRHTYDHILRYYEDTLGQRLLNRKYVTDHIRNAIRNGQIVAFFQPIIRVFTGKVCGYEALARWDDPEHGLLDPGLFITTLEDAHLIHLVDIEIARQVARYIRIRIDKGQKTVPVSINLSRLDFHLCDIVSEINDAVDKQMVPHDLIDIEITERALSEDDGTLRKAMERFRALGYKIWMDDFGSEYSSLNALKEYDFDVLKIDMQFLRGVNGDLKQNKSATIISSVINMAKELGIQTLCEGVETQEHYDFLKQAGCEKVQGYLFHKPARLEDLYKENKFEPESGSERGYMDKVGRINLLSQTPYEGNEISTIPMAVFEGQDNQVLCILCNPAFKQFLYGVRIDSIDQLQKLLLPENRKIFGQFTRAAHASFQENKEVSFDLVLNGDYCTLRIRGIAQNKEENSYTVLVKAMNISQTFNTDEVDIRENVLRNLYSVFERVDLLDTEKNRILTIYHNTGRFTGDYFNDELRKSLRSFVEMNVYPDDREEFLDFYDPENMIPHILESGQRYVFRFFRTRNQYKQYVWQVFIQILVSEGGKYVVMSAVCDADTTTASLAEKIADSVHKPSESHTSINYQDGESISFKENLLDDLLNVINAGIFWKDTDRRFLGANRWFRKYYGFTSDLDFIHKTDEEMGWHVDNEPFKDDEYRVIKYGESVINAPGTCISHGKVRKIRAWKSPVYEGDKIVGLVGYFIDVTNQNDSSGRASGAFTDSLTGLLDMHGLITEWGDYVQSYNKYQRDFGIITINITDFHDMNVTYGFEKTDHILIKVSETLKRVAGVNSTIARCAADKFIILHQFHDAGEVSLLRAKIARSIARIEDYDIDDFEITMNTQLYSDIPEKKRKNYLADYLSAGKSDHA